MNRSIEQALTSLIPRYNGTLPPELVELAGSLLGLSRTKASNLKAEEEIARTYTCANIACERLKQSLNLPKIERHPPCPPRIYNKLYTYFDSILIVRKRGRPPKSTSVTSTPTKSLPSRPTPTKTPSLAPFKPSVGGSTSRKRGLQYSKPAQDIAAWIHPIIRGLCKGLSAPAAAPHILAGVDTILTQPAPGVREADLSQAESVSGKIPALIAAVYFFVCTRLSGRETSGKEYAAQRKEVVNLLGELRADGVIRDKLRSGRGRVVDGNGDEDEDESLWRGWEETGPKDIDVWLMHISTHGWLQLDWFMNIMEGGGVLVSNLPSTTSTTIQTSGYSDGMDIDMDGDGDGDVDMEVDGEGETDMEMGRDRSLLKTGLGTMMQDRVDFLSQRRRKAYRLWRDDVLRRIADGEENGGVDE